MNLDQILDSIYPLPLEAKSLLLPHIQLVHYKKGHILLKANKVERMIYFIKKGIVHAYADKDIDTVTFWIGREGDAILSMRSYVENKPAYEHIELLEDCELYALNTTTLQTLFLQDIHIANWGRKLAEQELMKTEERLIAQQFKSATERYKDLLAQHPDLLQRVSLGKIASYLGITQVSLSRIRADIR